MPKLNINKIGNIRATILVCSLLLLWPSLNLVAQEKTDIIETVARPTPNLTIELSNEVQNAINSGVALTFETEFAHTKSWSKLTWRVHKKNHQFVIVRHALSNRYLVKLDTNEKPDIFRSIPEALDFVAYQALLLLESYNNKAEPHQMRIYLNNYKLPSPMRLNAFLSDKWAYNSGWQLWQ